MSVNVYNKTEDKLVPIAGATVYADSPIGSIVPYGGLQTPAGWLICDGRSLSKNDNFDLFKVIGYNFGGSDSTFNVPDLREATTKGVGLNGKSAYHYDADGVALGEFIDDRIQGHEHKAYANRTNAVFTSAGGTGMDNRTSINTNGIVTDGSNGVPRTGATTEVKAVGVNYIIKVKHTPIPADFMDAVDDAMNDYKKILPYSFNHSSNVSAFNRKWLVTGSSIVWTATHTGRLTIRCLKHGDGYSLYLSNQNNVMLDSYDNFFGDTEHGLTVSEASITLQAWVRKGDVIELSTNLPASTDWADKYFVQTGLLLYNDNYD